jgi:hypothetical protein
VVWVGFQNFADVSRVFVRTDTPGEWRLRDAGNHTLFIEFMGCRLDRKKRAALVRPLDTSFFPGPIARVVSRELGHGAPTVQVEIRLKGGVPYKAHEQDDTVYVDFPRDDSEGDGDAGP